MIVTTVLLSIPLAMDRQRYFHNENSEELNYTTEEPMIDIKDTYYITTIPYYDRLSSIKQQLLSYVGTGDDEISPRVYNNSLRILERISPLVYEKLQNDGLYTTNNRTVVFDMEKSDDIFSLEIGKDVLGYFIEKDGIDVLQIDKLSLNEMEFEQTSSKVLSDLQKFI